MGSENTGAVGERKSVGDESTDTIGNMNSEVDDTSSVSDRPELTLDTMLEVAQNERRRRILRHLATTDGGVQIGELAETLAAEEYDCPDGEPTSTQRKRMYVGLYQGHLPKMDDMGVVEFDKDRGRVEPGPYAGQVTRFVNRATGDEPAWPRYYLGLALLAGALFVVSLLVPASRLFVDMGLAVVLGLLAVTAGAHLYWQRGGPF